MSQHKNFVATNLSFFDDPEKCRDMKSLYRDKTSCLLALLYVVT